MIVYSPRELVERRSSFGPDAANPMAGTPARLRSRASLGLLLELNGDRISGATHAALGHVLLDHETDEVGSQSLLPSALAPSVFANGFLNFDFGPAVASLFPKVQFSFGAALRSVATHVLDEGESDSFRKVWTYLRQASGDAPLAPELDALARRRIPDLALLNTPDGLEPALHTVIAVAALGAVNGWSEVAARVDRAVDALWPLSTDVEQRIAIFFEIAHWRARFKANSVERGRIVADALRRFAVAEEHRDWVVMVARKFAGALAGQDAEPFVDVLADVRP